MKSGLDTFRLLPTGEIWVNERPLIDIIRHAELPAATAEYDQRIAEGESAREIYNLAGEYHYLPPTMLFLPSRNLLDEPNSLAAEFVVPENDPALRKATVLGCTCGISECWFLLVKITVDNSVVRWSDFQQFHRDWQYDLAYTFDRVAYERELQPPATSPSNNGQPQSPPSADQLR